MPEAWMESVPGHGLCCCSGRCCRGCGCCCCCRWLRCFEDDGPKGLGGAADAGHSQAVVINIHPAEIDLLHDEGDGLDIGEAIVFVIMIHGQTLHSAEA